MENTKKDLYILVRYPNDRLGVELWPIAYDMKKDGTVTELVGRASYDMQMLQATADKENEMIGVPGNTCKPIKEGVEDVEHQIDDDNEDGRPVYILVRYLNDYWGAEEWNTAWEMKKTGEVQELLGRGSFDLEALQQKAKEHNDDTFIDESLNTEDNGKKPIFTLSIFDVTNDEGMDDMQFGASDYETEEEAIEAAKKVAQKYSNSDSVINVSVMAGEYQMPSGDIYGEPEAIYTVSNKDRKTTAMARKQANFVNPNVDFYIVESFKKPTIKKQFCREIAEARVDFLIRRALREEAIKQPKLIEITNNAQDFGILSAVSDKDRTQELLEDLKNLGCTTIEQDGVYNGDHETSFIIIGISQNDLGALAKKYNQHSYIFARRNTQSTCGYEFLAFVRRGEGDNFHYQNTSKSTRISEFQDGSAQCYSYIPSQDYYYSIEGLIFESKITPNHRVIKEDVDMGQLKTADERKKQNETPKDKTIRSQIAVLRRELSNCDDKECEKKIQDKIDSLKKELLKEKK